MTRCSFWRMLSGTLWLLVAVLIGVGHAQPACPCSGATNAILLSNTPWRIQCLSGGVGGFVRVSQRPLAASTAFTSVNGIATSSTITLAVFVISSLKRITRINADGSWAVETLAPVISNALPSVVGGAIRDNEYLFVTGGNQVHSWVIGSSTTTSLCFDATWRMDDIAVKPTDLNVIIGIDGGVYSEYDLTTCTKTAFGVPAVGIQVGVWALNCINIFSISNAGEISDFSNPTSHVGPIGTSFPAEDAASCPDPSCIVPSSSVSPTVSETGSLTPSPGSSLSQTGTPSTTIVATTPGSGGTLTASVGSTASPSATPSPPNSGSGVQSSLRVSETSQTSLPTQSASPSADPSGPSSTVGASNASPSSSRVATTADGGATRSRTTTPSKKSGSSGSGDDDGGRNTSSRKPSLTARRTPDRSDSKTQTTSDEPCFIQCLGDSVCVNNSSLCEREEKDVFPFTVFLAEADPDEDLQIEVWGLLELERDRPKERLVVGLITVPRGIFDSSMAIRFSGAAKVELEKPLRRGGDRDKLRLSSPVITIDVLDSRGRVVRVSDLEEPLVIELTGATRGCRDKDELCLAFTDDRQDFWTCDRTSRLRLDGDTISALVEVDHLTSFAVLLRGGNSVSDFSDTDNLLWWLGPLIAVVSCCCLSIVFVLLVLYNRHVRQLVYGEEAYRIDEMRTKWSSKLSHETSPSNSTAVSSSA